MRRDGAVLLDEVTCLTSAGVCTALVGPSGAGKSTLLRLLNRLAGPTGGMGRFHDRPLADLDVLTLRHRVGLVGQQPIRLTDRVRTCGSAARTRLNSKRPRCPPRSAYPPPCSPGRSSRLGSNEPSPYQI